MDRLHQFLDEHPQIEARLNNVSFFRNVEVTVVIICTAVCWWLVGWSGALLYAALCSVILLFKRTCIEEAPLASYLKGKIFLTDTQLLQVARSEIARIHKYHEAGTTIVSSSILNSYIRVWPTVSMVSSKLKCQRAGEKVSYSYVKRLLLLLATSTWVSYWEQEPSNDVLMEKLRRFQQRRLPRTLDLLAYLQEPNPTKEDLAMLVAP